MDEKRRQVKPEQIREQYRKSTAPMRPERFQHFKSKEDERRAVEQAEQARQAGAPF